MQIKHIFFHLKLLLSWNSTRVAKKVCLARNNNHPTSLASSWDISFFKSLVQKDPTGSNKVAHLNIPDVYVSPNRKYINLSLIYYILDFSFFMSQDDTYFHIHQNDPLGILGYVKFNRKFSNDLLLGLSKSAIVLCIMGTMSIWYSSRLALEYVFHILKTVRSWNTERYFGV